MIQGIDRSIGFDSLGDGRERRLHRSSVDGVSPQIRMTAMQPLLSNLGGLREREAGGRSGSEHVHGHFGLLLGHPLRVLTET